MLVDSSTSPVSPDSAPRSTAEAEWKEIKNLVAQRHDLGGKPSRHEMMSWRDAHSCQVQDRLRQFYSDYPNHPLRWNAVLMMEQNTPSFIQSFGPESSDGKQAVTIDAAAKQAFLAKLAEYNAALAKAKDLPEEVVAVVDALEINQALLLLSKDSAPDFRGVHARLLEFARKHPGAAMNQMVGMYMRLAEKVRPDQAAADWASFINFPNAKIAILATNKVRAIELLKHPLDLAFTAVDGRTIDLVALRGKVVLLDFWATWCPPCRAELPNLRAVYSELHDQGFEIVGISFDDAEIAPTDAPEVAAEKLRVCKEEFSAFLEKEKMPWPQQFDGSGWRNPFGAKYGITSLPTMFLLDRSGRFVSSEVRKDSLKPAVLRLLHDASALEHPSDDTHTFCVPGGPCT